MPVQPIAPYAENAEDKQTIISSFCRHGFNRASRVGQALPAVIKHGKDYEGNLKIYRLCNLNGGQCPPSFISAALFTRRFRA